MIHVTCLMLHVICCMLEMPCILFRFHPNISHMSTCHMLHVTCHHVTCYMSPCHKLYVLYCTSYVIYCILEMPCILFWFQPNISHMSTCHMLHVTCYMSYDAFHMSHVIHDMSLEMPWMHACCSECIQPVSHFNLSYVTYVTCDMSHVICNMPHVTSHVPNVTCRISHVLGHVMHCSESMMLAK